MLLSPGECWALLSLTVDQLTTGGWLFLQAQRRPAPPWFICVFPMIDTDKRWRQSNNVKVSLIELIGEHILRGWLLALRGYSFLPAVGPCVGIKSSVSLISVSGLIYIVQEGGPQECPRAIYTPPRSSQAGGPKGDVTHRSPALQYIIIIVCKFCMMISHTLQDPITLSSTELIRNAAVESINSASALLTHTVTCLLEQEELYAEVFHTFLILIIIKDVHLS